MTHRKKNILKELSYFLTILAFILASSNCYGVEISNFRHWTAPDHTRIVLDIDDVPDYSVKENEDVLTLILKESSLHKTIPPSSIINKPGIKKIIFHRTKDDNVKIEFILDKHQKVEVFKLKKFQDKPNRIVVDIILEQGPKEEKKTKQEKKSVRTQKEKGININHDDWREETVNLGSLDIKYVAYLAKIKNKILQIWKYPQKAYEKNEEGNVIVRMSIDADGSLAGATLMSSAGYAELDDGALSVVQTSAPFEPLPENYNLSRLNIVASFQYKIMD